MLTSNAQMRGYMTDLMFQRQRLQTFFSICDSLTTQLEAFTSTTQSIEETDLLAELQGSIATLRGSLQICEFKVLAIGDWYDTWAAKHCPGLQDVLRAVGRMMCSCAEDASVDEQPPAYTSS